MKNIYVISDMHGCYDKFNKMLNLINLTKEDKLILLGDYIDRGNKSFGVLFKIIDLQLRGYDIIVLKGNHEQMFLETLQHYKSRDELDMDYWYVQHLNSNGTYDTLVKFFNSTPEQKKIIMNFMNSLKSYHAENNYLFVHAGVFPHTKLEDQTEEDLVWVRDEFINNRHGLPYTIIFGHTPTVYLNNDKSLKIWHGEDKIGIDCGCVFGGKLACLEINSMKEYYV